MKNLGVRKNSFYFLIVILKVVTTLLRKDLCCKINQTVSLKLVSGIFYQFFIFLPNDSPLKTMKYVFLFHLKSSFRSQDIQIL